MRAQDPVCGRSIDVAEVVAAEDDGGWAYFFKGSSQGSVHVERG